MGCPPGLAGDAGVGASYRGAVDPDSVANAGLGVKGAAFYSSYRGRCTVMWVVGGVSDLDAGTAVPEGRPHGWLSGRHHGGGGGFPLGRVGGKRWSGGWLGRALSFTGNGVAPIQIWGPVLVALVLETSWWHGGDAERKFRALSPTTATLVGAALFLKTSSWCSSLCLSSG